MVVHDIPDERPLCEGDIFSLDAGVKLNGWHADTALTLAVGAISQESQRLIQATRQALEAGVVQCRPGARLGDVGHAIETVAVAAGFTVMDQLVGHGIGRSLYEDPQVPNRGEPGTGPVLQEGWVLAVEPMLTSGSGQIQLLPDGWGVKTADCCPAAHFEHTVAVAGCR
ncbi:MAG: type I methionyl aminopeptidase [Actinomycetota bacterium]